MKRDAIPLGVPLLTPAESAWRRLLPAFAALVVLIVIAYAPTATSIVSTWYRSTTFNHGFLIVPIVGWLAWRKRDILRSQSPAPWLPASIALALLGFAWLAGQFLNVNALSQAAFVFMLIALVPAIFGREVTRTLRFPLAFLLFAIPFGDFMLPVLMDRTADFTVWALRMTGIPVYRDGWLIVVPNGQWSIVEACSGIRYLIASLMTGTLFAYVTYRSALRRWTFVAIAAVVAIVANWLRAYLVVLLGYLTTNRLAAGVDHLFYGWIFYGIVMLILFWVGARWHEPQASAAGTQARGTIPPRSPVSGSLWSSLGLFALVALAWPPLNVVTQVRDGGPVSLDLAPAAGWSAVSDTSGFVPHFESPSATINETWRSGGDTASLYIAYYRAQTPERKAVSSDSALTREEDKHWVRTVRGVREVSIGGAPRRIAETRVNGGDISLVAWQWYWIDGFVTSSEVLAKARIGWSRLTRHRDDTAAIVLYAEDGNGQDAERVLDRFTREAWPAIERALEQADGREP